MKKIGNMKKFMVFAIAFSLIAFSSAFGQSMNEIENAFINIAKETKDSVVFIQVEKKIAAQGQGGEQRIPPSPFGEEFFRRFIPQQFRSPGPQDRVMGQGSGFIVSKDGYILTNHHVVSKADKVRVRFSDRNEYEAEVVGTDPQADIGVIKIEANNLKPLQFGDSSKLQVGEWVVANGNPFGLSQTITTGVVSAKGRTSVGITDYEDFIQTDAAINLGNSGGPLINLEGEVIGINTAIFSRTGGSMGIGFAIPINMAEEIYEQIKETGTVTRGYLGVVIQNLTPELSESFDINRTSGVLVSDVKEGSPADEADMQEGDIVIEFDGKAVIEVGNFRNRVAMVSPGSKHDMVVLRDGKEVDLTVRVGKLPNQSESKTTKKKSLNELGFTIQEMTADLAKRLGYEGKEGVIVAQVNPNSNAARKGLRPGMLIMEVDRTPVHNPEEFQQIVDKSKEDGKILLYVHNGDHSRFIALNVN